METLRERLASALQNISAKDDLVKQHSKVAEEAVSGTNVQLHFHLFKSYTQIVWSWTSLPLCEQGWVSVKDLKGNMVKCSAGRLISGELCVRSK